MPILIYDDALTLRKKVRTLTAAAATMATAATTSAPYPRADGVRGVEGIRGVGMIQQILGRPIPRAETRGERRR